MSDTEDDAGIDNGNGVTLAERRSIGRHDELNTLQAMARRARTGMGSLALISGDPGMGKTTLLSDFSYSIIETSSVLRGSNHGAEGTPAFWPWTQALRRLTAGVDATDLKRWTTGTSASLAPLLPDLEALGAERAPVNDLEFAQLRFFDSVVQFLENASGTGSFVIMFEDLHWADVPTLQLLTHVAREVERLPIMFVASYRESEMLDRPDGHEFIRNVSRLPSTTTVKLRGIDSEATGRLIQQFARIDEPLPDDMCSYLANFSGGNPFFTTEIVDQITAGSTGPAALARLSAALDNGSTIAVPDSLREVAEQRLERVSFGCYELLRIASVLGRDFELAALRIVGQLPADETEKLVHEAIRARLLEPVGGYRYGFTHSVFRETIVQGASVEWVTDVHLRIARSLRDAPASAHGDDHQAQLAYHFAEAALAGADAPEALPLVMAAGDHAMDTHAYDRAHEQYKLARQLLQAQGQADPATEFDVAMASCRAFAAAGHRKRRNAAALESAALAEKLEDGRRFSEAALAYQGQGLESGVVDHEAVRLLRRALDVMPDEGSQAHRALAMSRLAQELHFAGGEEAAALSDRSIALAEQFDDAPTLAMVLRTRHASLRGPGDIAERTRLSARMVKLADEADDLHLRLSALLRHAVDLLEIGSPGELAQVVDQYSALAHESAVAQFRWSAMILEATRSCLYGRLDEAARQAEQAHAFGHQHGQELAWPYHLIQRWLNAIHQGSSVHLEPDFRRVVDAFPALPAWRAGVGMVYREAGRLVEASGEYSNVLGQGVERIPVDGNWLMSLDYLAQICSSLGDTEHAEAIYEALARCEGRMVVIGRGVGCTGAVDRSLGLLAALRDERELAVRHFEAALNLNAKMGARPYLAWTRIDYAGVLLDWANPHDLERARELVRAAVADARELGLDSVIARGDELLPRIDRLASLFSEADAFEQSITSDAGIVTVLVTDLVGSTSMQRRLGDHSFFEVLEAHNVAVRSAVDAENGVEIKHTGDGIMAGFRSAHAAVRAARTIQATIEERNRTHEHPIGLRIGLNSGEAIVDGHDVFGISVTTACRICDHADDGQILVSGAVRELCNDSELGFRRVDDASLKGYDEPLVVFALG